MECGEKRLGLRSQYVVCKNPYYKRLTTFTFLHIPPCVLNGFPINITRMAINHDRIRGDGHLFLPRETRSKKHFSIFHPSVNRNILPPCT